MRYDLGFFDHETWRIESEEIAAHVSGINPHPCHRGHNEETGGQGWNWTTDTRPRQFAPGSPKSTE